MRTRAKDGALRTDDAWFAQREAAAHRQSGALTSRRIAGKIDQRVR